MTVHLVGAGPGSADLLTIKASRLLATADAVVYDRLIGDDVLDHAAPSAELYPVGKTPGKAGPSQGQINDLLIHLGLRLSTVVRIKGGDPYVFGRGIEEKVALGASGIDVEVVPGISSAFAGPMAAGFSVTERGVSSGVSIVTAHQDPDSQPIDWSALARSGLTIVVLMGARRAARIRDLLIGGGLAPTTPAAVVANAARLNETTWIGALHDLGRTPVTSPSVLIIGEVVKSPTDTGGQVAAPTSTIKMAKAVSC